MYYPSKKDIWLAVINWAVIISCFLPLAIQRDYIALFFTIPLALFLGWSWFTTGYRISNELLIIQSGPLKKRIPIKDIKKIISTKNPLASSALSFDRIEISYGTDYGMVLVSPKNKSAFVKHLKNINPQIELEKRLKEVM
ncbi:PH domain-containing protein [Viridibacillus arvi]|uniref:PH domain-containing protein n=1 Tax=Viridibacillus arvi TaxID=263475 RepID=UPI00187B4ED7|nr:PH domain-containing protein [Viridibacillus sp. JNUCC-6]QOV11163.1 PH domain-containing protein [Viridibacillus sp. JNUCC-6]